MSSFLTDGIGVIKSGKLLFNHPQGTHDDQFWAIALAVYAAVKTDPLPSKSRAYTT